MKDKLIKIAYHNPDLREKLLPIIKKGGNASVYREIKTSRLVESGALTDPSHLKHQAVFLMGAAGSGKSYVVENKYLKHMPSRPGPGFDQMDESVKEDLFERTLSEAERELSNLNFEAAVENLQEKGIDIELVNPEEAEIPFELYTFGDEGRVKIERSEWADVLDEDVYREVKDVKNLIFNTPVAEIPSYWRQVNPDLYKQEIPGYRDDEPEKVHPMSSDMSRAYFHAILESGDPVIIDGTGRKEDKMIDQITAAQEHGYQTTLLYVYVPLTISLLRNANRNRQVPPDIVLRMYGSVKQNFPRLKNISDRYKFIDNRAEENEKGDSFDKKTWRDNKEKINQFMINQTGMNFPMYILEHKPEERNILRDLEIIERGEGPQDLIERYGPDLE